MRDGCGREQGGKVSDNGFALVSRLTKPAPKDERALVEIWRALSKRFLESA